MKEFYLYIISKIVNKQKICDRIPGSRYTTNVLKNMLVTFCLSHGFTNVVLYSLKITNKISFFETGKI